MKAIDISTPKFPNTETLVDDADYAWAMQWKWYAFLSGKRIYAARRQRGAEVADGGKSKLLFLHREMVHTPAGMDTDHRDNNSLNNQRDNLRTATRSQNNCNSRTPRNNKSGRKGVCWNPRSGKWRAHIVINKRQRHLGLFKTIEEATNARQEAEKVYHGEFAYGLAGSLQKAK
jgi:hypothetical protein